MQCRFCGKELLQKDGKWICSGCGFVLEAPSMELLKSVQLSPQEAKKEIDSRKPFILDVREPWEHELANIPRSVLIPLRELAAKLHLIPKDKEIIVYCHHGNRSLLASHFLVQKGFKKVKNLEGGIEEYSIRADSSIPQYG